MPARPPGSTLFPYTTLFRSPGRPNESMVPRVSLLPRLMMSGAAPLPMAITHERCMEGGVVSIERSEEHTSELQSPCNVVCRLLLEKKKYAKYRVTVMRDIIE